MLENKQTFIERVELAKSVISELIIFIDEAERTYRFDKKELLCAPLKTLTMLYAMTESKKIRGDLRELRAWLGDTQLTHNFADAHELLCEFNHSLVILKPTLVRIFSIPSARLEVTPTELFDAVTYGGSL